MPETSHDSLNNFSRDPDRSREVIGLLPAAGLATRIAPLPMSKEIYPIGFQAAESGDGLRPKVVCQYVLENMRRAGITKAFLILRSGKWDIPAYFGDGAMLEMNLGYLLMRSPYGVPYTLDQAFPFVQNAIIALGFPDLLLQPNQVYVRLLNRLDRCGAEVVLGVFPSNQPEKVGMVEFDAAGQVQWIVEKPKQTHLRYMWGVAVWTPAFTQFLHEYLATIEKTYTKLAPNEVPPPRREIPIGDVIQAAIQHGLSVEAEVFEAGRYLDIGTPEDLMRAVQNPNFW
jgi:glucose-1-phosphate thymidylyltransferase